MAVEFPRPLAGYPVVAGQGLGDNLAMRVQLDPFNAIATAIFVLAIIHTFGAARLAGLAHHVQERHDAEARGGRRKPGPSPAAELLHFFGEVEVVFGLWAVVLLVAA